MIYAVNPKVMFLSFLDISHAFTCGRGSAQTVRNEARGYLLSLLLYLVIEWHSFHVIFILYSLTEVVMFFYLVSCTMVQCV